MKTPNPEVAIRLFYTTPEINNKEIRELFDCNTTTATRLKKQVKEEMAKRNIKTWLPKTIDIVTAYEVWHIDVEQMERNLAKLQKLKKSGVIKQDAPIQPPPTGN